MPNEVNTGFIDACFDALVRVMLLTEFAPDSIARGCWHKVEYSRGRRAGRSSRESPARAPSAIHSSSSHEMRARARWAAGEAWPSWHRCHCLKPPRAALALMHRVRSTPACFDYGSRRATQLFAFSAVEGSVIGQRNGRCHTTASATHGSLSQRRLGAAACAASESSCVSCERYSRRPSETLKPLPEMRAKWPVIFTLLPT